MDLGKTFQISNRDFVEFREASGDDNPVHGDPEWARLAGLAACPFYGAGLLLKALSIVEFEDSFCLASLDVRWHRAVYVEEGLRAHFETKGTHWVLKVDRGAERVMTARGEWGADGLKKPDLLQLSRKVGCENPGPGSLWLRLRYQRERFLPPLADELSRLFRWQANWGAGWIESDHLAVWKNSSPLENRETFKDRRLVAFGVSRGLGFSLIREIEDAAAEVVAISRSSVTPPFAKSRYESHDLSRPAPTALKALISQLRPECVLLAAQDGKQAGDQGFDRWLQHHVRMTIGCLKEIKEDLAPNVEIFFLSTAWTTEECPDEFQDYVRLKQHLEEELAVWCRQQGAQFCVLKAQSVLQWGERSVLDSLHQQILNLRS